MKEEVDVYGTVRESEMELECKLLFLNVFFETELDPKISKVTKGQATGRSFATSNPRAGIAYGRASVSAWCVRAFQSK